MNRTLRVEGRQIPQTRPRVTHTRTYNVRNPWREAIQWEASQVFRGYPLEGRKRIDVRLVGCQKRGDLDNYAKAVLDALQGHAYRNDNQVDDLRIRREPGVQPYTSKCAQAFAFSTKRLRKSAAVIEPAKAPLDTLFMSATLESSIAS